MPRASSLPGPVPFLIAALRSVAAYLLVSVYILLVGPPALLWASLRGSPDLLYALGHWGIELGLRTVGVRYRVVGAEHLIRDRAAVYCANHQSNLDPPVCFRVLHPRLKVMYKAELSRLPLLGRAFRLGGFVPVERAHRERAMAAVDEGARKLAAGESFLIFPEGTRSRTDALLPFKKGGFVMAIKAQAPIVPVAVRGGRGAMAKGSAVIRPAEMVLTIGPPIETAGSSLDDRHGLVARVRQEIERMLHSSEPGLPQSRSQSVHSARLVLLTALLLPPLAGAGVSPAAGPSQPAQPQQPPTFRVGANYVRVDAYATRGGVPVVDLGRDEFEVLEDGKPQQIATFEHVLVRGGGPQATRVEPGNARESAVMAGDPRARVFVIFLDVDHVSVEGAHRIREPLVRLLNRLIGDDDLFAVMTPYMSARDIAFTRRSTTIERELARYWDWGERDRLARADPREDLYDACFGFNSAVTREMIVRRRERLALESMEDLIRHLRDVRDERKAVLTVSEGWLLYRPNQALAAGDGRQPIPGGPPIFIGPGGKLGMGTDPRYGNVDPSQCDRDRMHLALLDDENYFRTLLGAANHANVSFYTIDPAGLRVFDTPISQPMEDGLAGDRARLTTRLDTLRELALNTDGLSVVDTNDPDLRLKRIVDDLGSYYLIGYYSDAATDGRYHAITVRVKRPGVSVRARNGYQAVKAEVARAAAVAAAPGSPAPPAAVEAIRRLAPVRPGTRFHLRAAAGPRAAGDGVWVAGEIDAAARSAEWAAGGRGLIEIASAGGATVATAAAVLPAGRASFLAMIPLAAPLGEGQYTVRVRLLAEGADPIRDAVEIAVAKDPGGTTIGQTLLYKRGPTTGAAFLPAADLRFRRAERIRVDLAVPAGAARPAGRLLDRTGGAMPVPVSALARKDPDGTEWITGELALAPLAQGDYVVELAYEAHGARHQVLTALRVVP